MLWNAFFVALNEIRRNLLRAFLTVLGIVIGVAAVITMVSLGQGATESVTQQVESLGSNLIVVRPGRAFGGPGGGGSAPNFRISDAEAIAEQVSGVRAVAPVTRKAVSAVYLQENWSTTATGSTPDYFDVSGWTLDSGRYFTDAEYRTGRPVCVIGKTLETQLFGQGMVQAQHLRIGHIGPLPGDVEPLQLARIAVVEGKYCVLHRHRFRLSEFPTVMPVLDVRGSFRRFTPGQNPTGADKMAGIAIGHPFQIVLMFGLCFPEIADRLHLGHDLAGP